MRREHLEHTDQALPSEPRLEVLRFVVRAVAAARAARALHRDHIELRAACTC